MHILLSNSKFIPMALHAWLWSISKYPGKQKCHCLLFQTLESTLPVLGLGKTQWLADECMLSIDCVWICYCLRQNKYIQMIPNFAIHSTLGHFDIRQRACVSCTVRTLLPMSAFYKAVNAVSMKYWKSECFGCILYFVHFVQTPIIQNENAYDILVDFRCNICWYRTTKAHHVYSLTIAKIRCSSSRASYFTHLLYLGPTEILVVWNMRNFFVVTMTCPCIMSNHCLHLSVFWFDRILVWQK